ncbi:DUF6412 domain-containing protein [Streptomyces sp. NPDC048290]|uniref:DUF6412 domain-containing protein n=1 Tax=Streptomyces sp. NPDC048290 TaxID=3155811 RepID=UPI0034430F98
MIGIGLTTRRLTGGCTAARLQRRHRHLHLHPLLAALTALAFLVPFGAAPGTSGLYLTVALAATAAAGAALMLAALVAARSAPAVPPTRVRTAIRDRRRRTAFLPQRDPDARGRTRPRAPGHALPATVA